MKNQTVYQKWISEKEYVKSFADRGEPVPPFLVFMPYEEKDGEPGYLAPCQKDDPERKK